MRVPSRGRALAVSVLASLASSVTLAPSPAVATNAVSANPAGSAYRLSVPVRANNNNFRITWQPGGDLTDRLIADGTVTLSDDEESYTIMGELSIGGSYQNCNYFHGGTKMSVRRDGEEYNPATDSAKRWGWQRISEERTCNALHDGGTLHFEYTGRWEPLDERVLIDIRANPIIGSYSYSDNAKCERSGKTFEC